MRSIFMGSPDFAVSALDALRQAGHEIVAVYCQPPRPAGRGHQLQPVPVHRYADTHGLLVRHPKSLKSAEEQAAFAALEADIAVVAAYGLILPQAILEAPKHGCVNIHASLLPRWRGAAPIQRAIQAGDAETGVTIMQMDAGLDTGPMLRIARLPITATTTGASLHDDLAALGAQEIVAALADLPHWSPMPQPADGVTYAAKLQKDEGRIDWTQPASVVDRCLRAFTPAPGGWCLTPKGERVRIGTAEPVTCDHAATPGTVLDDRLTIACATDAIRLTQLQPAGKAAMAAAAYLNGRPIRPGEIFPAPNHSV